MLAVLPRYTISKQPKLPIHLREPYTRFRGSATRNIIHLQSRFLSATLPVIWRRLPNCDLRQLWEHRKSIGIRVLGLYRDNGKDNGNYYLGFRLQGLRIRV